MLYLKIENPGVAPAEAFTLFGATTKRTDNKHPLLIGTFGSGNKHATCLLLRQNINPIIYSGTLRLSFFTKPVQIKGVANTVEQQQVFVRYGGKDADGVSRSNEQELSVTLDYGTRNWHSVNMALREYVSNALDAYFEQHAMPGPEHRAVVAKSAAKSVRIEVVDESKVRARAGYTRVFVPVTPDVQEFYSHLGKWFLHFSEPQLLDKEILPKRNRNHGSGQQAVIYRRGVFVREFTASDKPSLFDYNLDLTLDESRNDDNWSIKNAASRALSRADSESLAGTFRALVGTQEYWESSFDKYGLEPGYGESEKQLAQRTANWNAAIDIAYGTDAVLVNKEAGHLAEMVSKRGYKPIPVCEQWLEAANRAGVSRVDKKILSEDDKKGRKLSEPTNALVETLLEVWYALEALDKTRGKAIPEAACFAEPIVNGSRCDGFYRDGKIYVHEEIAGGKTIWLKVAVIEECAHYITGATDFSRDFQTWLVQVIAALLPAPLTSGEVKVELEALNMENVNAAEKEKADEPACVS